MSRAAPPNDWEKVLRCTCSCEEQPETCRQTRRLDFSVPQMIKYDPACRPEEGAKFTIGILISSRS